MTNLEIADWALRKKFTADELAKTLKAAEARGMERAAKICDGLAGDDSTFDRWTRKGAGQSAFAIRQSIQVDSKNDCGGGDGPTVSGGKTGTQTSSEGRESGGDQSGGESCVSTATPGPSENQVSPAVTTSKACRETWIAEAEGAASYYCQLRAWPSERTKNDAWSAYRAGYLQVREAYSESLHRRTGMELQTLENLKTEIDKNTALAMERDSLRRRVQELESAMGGYAKTIDELRSKVDGGDEGFLDRAESLKTFGENTQTAAKAAKVWDDAQEFEPAIQKAFVAGAEWQAKQTAPADTQGLQAAYDLASEQLRYDQGQIREAHELLNKAGVPTNGPEGTGKRQDLSLPQRIAYVTRPDNNFTQQMRNNSSKEQKE